MVRLAFLTTLVASLASLVVGQASKDYYGFVYFTGEGLSNGEQIYFAVSPTNSPVSWNVVNGGRPVLTSTLGTRGLRDPFIIRDPAGTKFYLIATDLRMYGGLGGSWDYVQRNGSRSIAVWESTNLKDWSAQRLVQVSPETAGMVMSSYSSSSPSSLPPSAILTWAPESYYSTALGRFVVFWASKLYSTSDSGHTGSSYARILYATTTDFRTFSAAATWIDPGRDIIDTTVAYDPVTKYFHRFSKTAGRVLQQRSTDLFGTWTTVFDGIGNADYGDVEGPLVFESNRYPGVWHVFVDDLSPQGYVPYETSNITAGNWVKSSGYTLPTNPRHGTVFSISAAEAANLRSINA